MTATGGACARTTWIAACVCTLALGAAPGARAQDAVSTRLLIGPTADALPKGAVYVGTVEIAPVVQVGLTDRVSIGAGGFPSFVLLTPKVQVYRSVGTRAAVGLIHAVGAGDNSAGLAYGVVTRGGRTGALTVGAAMAYSSSDTAFALVMIGGERRLDDRWSFVTDNWIGAEGFGFLSGGFRVRGSHSVVDLGALALIDGCSGSAILVPVVNFSYRF